MDTVEKVVGLMGASEAEAERKRRVVAGRVNQGRIFLEAALSRVQAARSRLPVNTSLYPLEVNNGLHLSMTVLQDTIELIAEAERGL